MDSRMIERLWRSLNYECVYQRAFETGSDAKKEIAKWLAITTQNDPTPPTAY
jgi:putative transposase